MTKKNQAKPKTKKPVVKSSSRKKPLIIIGIVVVAVLILGLTIFGIRRWLNRPIFLGNPSSNLTLAGYQHPLIPQSATKNLPNVSATNYILVDVATNTVLFSQGGEERIYPASITKLATALTALNIYPLDEVVTINTPYTEGKIMELKVSEQITVRSLVNALLVYSANDAAFNLASHHRDGAAGFVDEMNGLMKKYNLKNTHFTNYDGIHSPDHYSTVYDLAQLGRLAIKNPVIRDAVRNKNLTVTDITGQITHPLISTNELLGVTPEIEGLKTGWTPEAGGCFIALINLNGHYLISVVAQSSDRFADTKAILDWSKTNLTWLPYTP